MTSQTTTDERPVLDLDDVLREKFCKGEGIIYLQSDMPDEALVATIKYAASFGKPFTVIPPGKPFVYLDGMPDDHMIPHMQKLLETQGRDGGFLPILFPVSKEGKSLTLNPLDHGSPNDVLDFLTQAAEVDLTPDERKTALTIIESLPAGAGMRQLIDAFNAETASRLGISVDTLHALTPLFEALNRMAQPGRYGKLFEPNA